MFRRLRLAILFVLLPTIAAALTYPPARTVDQVDDYHGSQVADPYRWLEDIGSDEVAAWVAAESAKTSAYLDTIDGRDRLLARFKALSDYPRYSMPSKEAGRYFYSANDGLQNQWVRYWAESLDAEPKVLFDPNTWSEDGTIALAGMDISEDGSRVLFARSSKGSDWVEWQVMDIDTGHVHDELIRWSKGGGKWNADGSGFYYERYPEPAPGEETQAAARSAAVWYHRLGTSQSDDRRIFDLPEHPDWLLGLDMNEERDLGLITVYPRGSMFGLLSLLDLTDPGAKPTPFLQDPEHEYNYVTNVGDRLYFLTTKDAPLGRVIAVDRRHPEEARWETIIPEGRYPLQWVSEVGGALFVGALKDARSQVLRYDLQGRLLADVALPGLGTVRGFRGRRDATETFYSYADFLTPTTLYRYDLATGESSVYRRYEVPVDTSPYTSQQVFCRSVDGVAIPLFLTYRKDLVRNGTNPTMLYGYGGFGVSQQPHFSSTLTAWLDMGGVYALACIRGGGEYGEPWHQAGSLEGRPLTFQDMIACAEWLVDSGYTTPHRLALMGGSQGGMMVGAVVNARPDLFGVSLPLVGVMDMLRFNLWGYGSAWESDYGNPQDPAMFPVLYGYSPYHNLKEGVRYPATMVCTADTDDRVMPAHSFKYAARLQAVQPADGPPVLLRVETRAGHGGGTPLDKSLAEYADLYAFTAQQMGVPIPHWP
ncbi:MAG: prolyl oligopeptidase family serine peptidase [Candidatus Krumholzibacteriia bacterium]